MKRIAVSVVMTTLAAVSWTSLGLAAPGRPAGEGRTFTRGGVTLWYEVLGASTGRPLVVVNGGPGFDHAYLRVSDAWDRIARTRPVVMYDQRGNGRSGPLAEGTSCTLVDQVDDLEALRAELDQETIDLLGHSWGGLLAMAYTARHPDRVAHLVIADSAAPKWTDTEFIFSYVYPETVQRKGVYDALDAVGDATAHSRSLREYMSMLCVSRARSDELVAASAAFAYSRRINEMLNADLAQHDLGPALATFGMPTLVVTGRFDINVAPSTAWRIHQAVPGSRFVVFERSGHLPFFEEPEAWVRVVEDFLSDRAAP